MNKILLLRACFTLTLLPLSAVAASPLEPSPSDADVGISIEQVGVLVFPPSMLYSGVSSGEVHTAISVDQEGKLVDYLLISYTEKAFADAAVAAIKRWKYQAARVHGRAQSSRADVIFSFRDQGVVVQSLPGAAERRVIEEMLNGRFIYRACQLRDLDRIPTPVHVVPPVFSGDSRKRTVTVGFYIDEEGKVRLPSVSRDDADDFLAAAAVEAVEKWRFEPPLRKGFPVLVYAEQEFNFTPKE
jgi:TonB family protein